MKHHPTTHDVISTFDIIMRLTEIERHNTLPSTTQRRENVAEHSYGLATLACPLAASLNSTELIDSPLDLGEIAQIALIHDLPEVFMRHGDISVYADTSLLSAKATEEAAAIRQLRDKTQPFPWIIETIEKYEAQKTAEARFVYALDKIIVHIIVLISNEHHAKPTYKRYLETEVVAHQKIAAAFPALLPYFEDLSALMKAQPHFFSNQKTTG